MREPRAAPRKRILEGELEAELEDVGVVGGEVAVPPGIDVHVVEHQPTVVVEVPVQADREIIGLTSRGPGVGQVAYRRCQKGRLFFL